MTRMGTGGATFKLCKNFHRFLKTGTVAIISVTRRLICRICEGYQLIIPVYMSNFCTENLLPKGEKVIIMLITRDEVGSNNSKV